ncbi:hypothetical protein M9Y10_044493 [Tritrichomonas musculus]|uniref:Uncharacterized protein n=1 Tax=Tritrichomonas musculus TaxID=1915356 RepID=A0ABR2JSK3_9EUKA
MNLTNGVTSMKNNKFINPRITFNETYLMDYINEDDKPRLYMSKSLMDKLMDLFTSGFIRINYIAKTKQTINANENQLINFKCNQIDADNCFKLYRSPLPDFYEMKSYGITDDKQFYYADYGYLPGSPEFEALIDGQTFEFHDEAFGTDYKMTKQGNEWIGNNVSYHIPKSTTIKGETKFFKHQTQAIYIKRNDTNGAVLRAWIKYYSDENPFKIINDEGLIKFVDCELDRYEDDVDGCWAMYLKCTQKKSCDFSCSLMINDIEYKTEFGFEYASYEAESCYKVNSDNCYDCLPFHYNGTLHEGNPPYGLKIYMRTDKELIHEIADVNYEEGMNTFEFLSSAGYYTVSPRPEACTTLFTNYNIQTSGVVIGENIESHVFVLNSLGNTVDIAVNHINELQNYCMQLEKEINDIKNKQNWFDIVKDVVCIAGSCVNFMGGPKVLMSVAEKGLTKLLGFSFQADEEIVEDAVIVACDRASTVLAEEKKEELEFVDEVELLDENIKRYKYMCFSIKGDEHLNVSFMIDETGETLKINTYKINNDLSITNISEDESHQCRIVYESPYLIIDTIDKPFNVELKRILKLSSSTIGLGENLKDNHILSSAATVKLIENHKTALLKEIPTILDDLINEASLSTKLNDYYTSAQVDEKFIDEDEMAYELDKYQPKGDYALKSEIPTIPDDLINETTLMNTLNDYALKSEIPTIPDDLINETTLMNTLNDYALKSEIPTIPDDLINETTLMNTLNDYALKTDLPTDLINETTLTNRLSDYTKTETLIEYRKLNNMTVKSIKNISFTKIDETMYETDLRVVGARIKGSVKLSTTDEDYQFDHIFVRSTLSSGDLLVSSISKFTPKWNGNPVNIYWFFDKTSNRNEMTIRTSSSNKRVFSLESITYEELDELALKSSIPTIPDDLVNETTLTNRLNNYKKSNTNAVLNGQLTINSPTPTGIKINCSNVGGWMNGYNAIGNNMEDKEYIANFIGEPSKQAYYGYHKPGIGSMGVSASPNCITFTSGSVNLNHTTTVNGNLTVNGTFNATTTNTTITHYSPIETQMSSINDFTIGGPVYMSGKVYKQTNDGWKESTTDDTTDCICSVKATGKWNEYVGICVSIDEDNQCITFATHGDYMVKVNDTTLYNVGDEIFIDDNVLKILSGNTAITSKIQRTTIGIITAKINDKFMSVFKS